MAATRSACFLPDNYTDLRLFANRIRDVDDLVATLDSFVAPGSPGEARILIRGDRGVGKSMLTRAALKRIVDTRGPLLVQVDAARVGHGPESFLRRLAKDLAREIIENSTLAELRLAAELLRRIADGASKLTVKQVQGWAKSLDIGATVKSSFLDSIQFEFGMKRAISRSANVEQTYERSVDADYLRERLEDFLADCQSNGQFVLLFLDNLDQVGYGELREDVEQVSNLAKYLVGLPGAVVVANLRSEFVSTDIRRYYSIEKLVEGLKPAELVQIAQHRMSLAEEDRRERLVAAGFPALIEELSRLTENAWSFLSWLAFFDYEDIDFDPRDPQRLRQALLRFGRRRFAGLVESELVQLAKVYHSDVQRFVTQVELDTHGVTKELLDRAVRYGALIPDLLLHPDRYVLSPALHFLAGLAGTGATGPTATGSATE